MNTKSNFLSIFSGIGFPCKVFIVSRTILFIIAYLSLSFIPPRVGSDLPKFYPEKLFIDGWVRWDSSWYYDIAKNGYSYTPAQQANQENIAFFPLYPYLVRYFNFLVDDFYLSGILIANIAFLLALIGLFILVSAKYGEAIAEKTSLLLAFSPFSFFFSAMYSESLFFLCIILVFLCAFNKKWLLASLFAAAAGATRIIGILSVLPVLYLYLESIQFNFRLLRWKVLTLGLAALGPMSYMLYLWVRFGSPFVFLRVYTAPGWNQNVNLLSAYSTIKQIFINLFESPTALSHGLVFGMNEIHLINLLISIIILGLAFKKIHPAYFIWSIFTIAASFSGWVSMSRYLLVVFPLFLSLAILSSKKTFDLILAASACLLGLFTILFSHWYWVS